MTPRPVVALVTDAIHPYNLGGKELRQHELVERLSQHAEVHVFTMRWWDGPRVRTEGQVTFHAISRLLPLYRNEVRSGWQALVFALACLRLLRRRFDILDVDQIPFLPLLTVRLVATLRRKPMIATWHEVWGRECWRGYLRYFWWPAWCLERLTMRAPDHIIAASPETATRLKDALGEHASIATAPSGIDLERVREAVPAEETTDLVVVSRLMNHKRLDLLLQAVALLHAEGRQVTCRIIGDGPEREALHEQAARLGIAHAVDFRHDVSEQKDLYSLIKAGRVFAFPSTREGFGIAVLEALSCGVPVVTTSAQDNLAQHLVLRSHCGIVCDPTLPAFAGALKVVLDRPRDVPVKEDLWLSEYTWESISSRVLDLYAEARSLNPRSPRPVGGRMKAFRRSLLEVTMVYGLLGWCYVAALAAVRPDSLPGQLASWLPLRRDTFGMFCFAASALAYFILQFSPRPLWRRGTRYHRPAEAGLRTLVAYPLLAWAYLGVNSLTHPSTVNRQLTHFAAVPTESTTAVLCFAVSAVALLALRARRPCGGVGHG